LTAARAGAGVLKRAGLGGPGGVADAKGAGDYVTASDRAAESAIVDVLRRATPDIALLAEEAGGTRAGTMWAVDPLDGTTNFIHGYAQVGVSVGLLEDRRPTLGVVIGPFMDLEFAGGQGLGVTRNGVRLDSPHTRDPSRAIVATGFPFKSKHLLPRYFPMMRSALESFEDLRRAGSAALDLAFVAVGVFDGFFELGLSTWDVAAGSALVLESGGLVTDWEGGDGWLENGGILAGPPPIHAELLRLATSSR
jgi:myo-inositol-1(or 4)-monophosphatase